MVMDSKMRGLGVLGTIAMAACCCPDEEAIVIQPMMCTVPDAVPDVVTSPVALPDNYTPPWPGQVFDTGFNSRPATARCRDDTFSLELPLEITTWDAVTEVAARRELVRQLNFLVRSQDRSSFFAPPPGPECAAALTPTATITAAIRPVLWSAPDDFDQFFADAARRFYRLSFFSSGTPNCGPLPVRPRFLCPVLGWPCRSSTPPPGSICSRSWALRCGTMT